MGRLVSNRTLKVYELIQELAQYSPDTDVVIDFELENGTVECPLCSREYETESKRSGMETEVNTTDFDRWKVIHLVCKEG